MIRWLTAWLTLFVGSAGATSPTLVLSIDGIATNMPVLAYSWLAQSVLALDGTRTIHSSGFTFTANETDAAPLLLAKTSNGTTAATARLSVHSPVTGALRSEWTFTGIRVASIEASATIGRPSPLIVFSLTFDNYTYRTISTPGRSITVAIGGSGAGTVVSTPAGIACPPTCTATFASDVSVGLTATPTTPLAGGTASVFNGWLGACTGRVSCVISEPSPAGVTAVFAPDSPYSQRVDIDANQNYDPLTDGLSAIRYLFGLGGSALSAGAVAPESPFATQSPSSFSSHLDDIHPLLDIDGNGQADALTDGLLLYRYLSGLRGSALINNALGAGATRKTAQQIDAYIRSLLP